MTAVDVDTKADAAVTQTRMVVVFRVITRGNLILFEVDNYAACENFCWEYPGDNFKYLPADELHIEKVWIPKK